MYVYSVIQGALFPIGLLLLSKKQENYRSKNRVWEKCCSWLSPLFSDHEYIENMFRRK